MSNQPWDYKTLPLSTKTNLPFYHPVRQLLLVTSLPLFRLGIRIVVGYYKFRAKILGVESVLTTLSFLH